MKLAVGAKVSLKTAEKWLGGGHVTEANEEALLRSMAELGFAKDAIQHTEPNNGKA